MDEGPALQRCATRPLPPPLLPLTGRRLCTPLLPLSLPQASAVVVAQAKAALDNPRLCGEPQLRDTAGDGNGAAAAFGATTPGGGAAEEGLMGAMRPPLLPACLAACAGPILRVSSGSRRAFFNSRPRPVPHLHAGFDMGAVVPVAEPDWSGAHHGLCLYASRVLQAVWDEQARKHSSAASLAPAAASLGTAAAAPAQASSLLPGVSLYLRRCVWAWRWLIPLLPPLALYAAGCGAHAGLPTAPQVQAVAGRAAGKLPAVASSYQIANSQQQQ